MKKVLKTLWLFVHTSFGHSGDVIKSMQTILLDNKTIFVTGAVGFIGSNLVLRLLSEARACSHSEESKQASLSSRSNAAFKGMSEGTIVGLDNLNDLM